ncbi:hypothetical protein NLU13_5417 [Sarocladium strictum]|uniref:Ubiquinone biosynthesis protein n=1 Tax=Sarocladium strictum TaxID=5046 RepID=A0AA39GHK4_SARSR|nr:hypothetical protein NLU13_5417 [Sarocladium strictum]
MASCARATRVRPTLLHSSVSIRTVSLLPNRGFHSHDHPPPSGPFTEVESAILSAGYKYVPEHGFTTRALGLGAKDAGYRDISPSVLSDGAFGLIRWHLVTQREGLKGRCGNMLEDDGGSVEGRVEKVTWERLLANKDIIHRWQEALAIMAQPSYVPFSLRELALLSDEILHLSGDVSVDPSWYTKRASLSASYASAELFMTNDTSPGFVDTQEFLRRRLDAQRTVGSAASSVREWVGFTVGAGVNVLRSKGVRI